MKLTSNLVVVANSQREFWLREFGAEVFVKDGNFEQVVTSLIRSKICPIVQVDNQPDELKFLDQLPENSFIGWLHADESNDLNFNRRVIALKSVRLVLRPYKIRNFSFRRSFQSSSYSLLNLNYARNLHEILKIFRWQIRGFGMQLRQAKISNLHQKYPVPFINIPLGYTDIFARSFIALIGSKNFPRSDSLFELDRLMQNKIPGSQISFVGQAGQIVRKFAIRSLKHADKPFILERDGFGASNNIDEDVQAKGLEYVTISRGSRFILSPPGNISGETFRSYESFLLNRIPLVMNYVTSDSAFSHSFDYILWSKPIQKWKQLIRKVQEISDEEYLEILKINRDKQREELAYLKMKLVRFIDVI